MLLTAAGARGLAAGASPLRFATTPVFLDDQIALLGRWQSHLEDQLKRPVVFVQRGNYREIVDLLLADQVDTAWLCGFPYVLHARRLHLVAVPLYQAQPLYRAHLIVPSQDTRSWQVGDLAGRIFAYSDPLSNSGWLVPRSELQRGGHDPDRFFRRGFFTFSHRKVVDAVRSGLADGGAVDGYVWDTLVAQHPTATSGVRVAWRSLPHGFPPVVARLGLPQAERDALAAALMHMPASPVGVELLQRLNIDGFERPRAGLFDSIRALVALQPRTRL